MNINTDQMNSHLINELDRYHVFDDPRSRAVPSGFIYKYAPYMIMSDNFKSVKDVLSRFYQPANIFLINSKFFNAKGTCKDVKDSIRNIVKESCEIKDPSFKDIISEKARTLIDYLRTYQKDNNLMESAMVNMSPIVPYDSTTIKKAPFDEGASFGETSIPSLSYINKLKAELKNNPNIEDNIRRHMHGGLYNILQNAPVFTSIFNNNLELLKDRGEDMYDAIAYYFMANLLHFNIPTEKALSFLDYAAKLSSGNITAQEMTELTSLMDPDSYYDIDMATEYWQNMTTTELDGEKIDELINTSLYSESKPSYDIQILLSYIYNHTYMVCDEYTNNTFMDMIANKATVTNVSYYDKDIMSCEINGKYTVIPYLDLSKDYKMGMLCMNKDGEVELKNDFNFD